MQKSDRDKDCYTASLRCYVIHRECFVISSRRCLLILNTADGNSSLARCCCSSSSSIAQQSTRLCRLSSDPTYFFIISIIIVSICYRDRVRQALEGTVIQPRGIRQPIVVFVSHDASSSAIDTHCHIWYSLRSSLHVRRRSMRRAGTHRREQQPGGWQHVITLGAPHSC
jgi:hypothetical protein